MTFLAFLTRILTGQKNFVMDHKKGFSVFLVTICYFGYLALGSYIFCLIEAPAEAKQQETVLKVKSNVMAKFPDMPESAINHLYEQLSAAGVKGIVLANDTPKWTYGNAFLFSMTLMTTIGYGHLSPTTQLGKVVCMFYTAVGIPVTLIILAIYVDLLTNISNVFKANLFRRLGYQQPFCVRTLHFLSVMVFIIVGTFILPAWVFYYLESAWSYLDSIYFCFISLTTVGLGDFVPGTATHPQIDVYRVFATMYLFTGVTIVMFMMGLATDYYQNCNKGFHIIPVKVIPPEKVPIMPEAPPSYGAIVIPETIDETRLLLS